MNESIPESPTNVNEHARYTILFICKTYVIIINNKMHNWYINIMNWMILYNIIYYYRLFD